mmetsp:Transcript_23686/g.44741  ORF Transcript_23686/g.44741 Transcript_23686/m.44741 type:complete len:258 (+) Transcript_23686:52-825(+)
MPMHWLATLCLATGVLEAQAFIASSPGARTIHGVPLSAGGERNARNAGGSYVPWCLATVATAGALRSSRTIMRGLKDRVKKDFSVKSAMIRRLGKWRLMKEFDMRKQIMDNPDMATRCGKSQAELIEDFNKASNFLKTTLGLEDQNAEICISKVSTGLNMQFLGKPNIPSNEDMATVMDWLVENLAVTKEDGSLKRVVEQYPFMLGRSIDDLEESQNFCPEDIDFKVAVADDPALIDKTYNCQGICASQCVSCWYNG